MTGVPMVEVAERMCSPVRASSSLANPRRIAESWFPLDRTTRAPASMIRVTASESSRTVSGAGMARS